MQREEEVAAYYGERDMAAFVLPGGPERAPGLPAVPNEEMAEAAAASGGVLIPFASIDPFRGRAGVAQARALAERYGVKGFKFHPNIQGFFPNDRMAYGLYEAIEELGAIALFHTGQTGIGAGVPGGGGIRLKYSNPLYLDDVAVDFPHLKIIPAHPSLPLQGEAPRIATHKPRRDIHPSGWAPEDLPPP